MTIKEQETFATREVFERVHQALIPDGLDGSPIFPEDWERWSNRLITGLDGCAIALIGRWLLWNVGERLDNIEFIETDPIEALEFVARTIRLKW